jgi:hypothetical protein
VESPRSSELVGRCLCGGLEGTFSRVPGTRDEVGREREGGWAWEERWG